MPHRAALSFESSARSVSISSEKVPLVPRSSVFKSMHTLLCFNLIREGAARAANTPGGRRWQHHRVSISSEKVPLVPLLPGHANTLPCSSFNLIREGAARAALSRASPSLGFWRFQSHQRRCRSCRNGYRPCQSHCRRVSISSEKVPLVPHALAYFD